MHAGDGWRRCTEAAHRLHFLISQGSGPVLSCTAHGVVLMSRAHQASSRQERQKGVQLSSIRYLAMQYVHLHGETAECIAVCWIVNCYQGIFATSWLVYNLYVRFTAGVVLSCPVVPASASRCRGNQALGRAILFLLLPPWLHCDAGTRALSLATLDTQPLCLTTMQLQSRRTLTLP